MNALLTRRDPHTFALTVTYGDRYALLQQVVQGAFRNGVEKVIVVDNGSFVASKQAIKQMEADFKGQVAVVELPENLGSAAGFKTGLKFVQSCADCDFVWLLDDDNCPLEGALPELLQQYNKLSRLNASNRLALVSLRSGWQEHNKLAHGASVKKVYPRKSSFMGIHCFLTPPRLWVRLSQAISTAKLGRATDDAPVEIPYGPYGGLFFHKSALEVVGYPDERLFLYNDDTEFTSRFRNSGGSIFLVPGSRVHDLEPSWHVLNKDETLFSHLLLTKSDRRIFYATRNQTYLETHVWPTNIWLYNLNRWFFFLLLWISAVRHGRAERFRLIARAVDDGRLGRLGFVPELEKT